MNPELHENLNNKENNESHLLDKKRKVKSSIYLLPNLITSASLFLVYLL